MRWLSTGGAQRPPTPRACWRTRVSELSGGLPFYTELLVEAGWSDEQPVNETIRDLASTPLLRLGPAGRRVVHAASVEDGRLSHAVLSAVLGDDVDVEAGIEQAVGAGVLTAEPGGDGYRFRHALIREAVRDRLLPAGARPVARPLGGVPGGLSGPGAATRSPASRPPTTGSGGQRVPCVRRDADRRRARRSDHGARRGGQAAA